MSARDAADQLLAIMAPLGRWLNDPATEDVCINQPREVWVRQRGRFTRHETPLDYDDCYDIAILAGALNQQNVGERHPLLVADLPRSERLQVVLPPCVPQGTVSLTLRIHGKHVAPLEAVSHRYNTRRWNRWQKRKETRQADFAALLRLYDDGDIVGFFREAVRLRMNILLCGATGSGKTTTLKTILSVIEPNERIITIENALELSLINQPNHVRLLYSHGDQGVASVTQKQLLEAYLRMRPDRGCVGELRDPEAAFTYVSELMTGHPGSPSTIHGKDASQAVTRLFDLVKGSEAGRNYSDQVVISQLGMVVDVVVPFRERGGSFEIGETWFAADAERRGTTIAELMEG